MPLQSSARPPDPCVQPDSVSDPGGAGSGPGQVSPDRRSAGARLESRQHPAGGGDAFWKVPTKKETNFGNSLHLLLAASGVIPDFELAPSNASDPVMGKELLVDHTDQGVVGDKGYVSATVAADLRAEDRTALSTVLRRNQTTGLPAAEWRAPDRRNGAWPIGRAVLPRDRPRSTLRRSLCLLADQVGGPYRVHQSQSLDRQSGLCANQVTRVSELASVASGQSSSSVTTTACIGYFKCSPGHFDLRPELLLPVCHRRPWQYFRVRRFLLAIPQVAGSTFPRRT